MIELTVWQALSSAALAYALGMFTIAQWWHRVASRGVRNHSLMRGR